MPSTSTSSTRTRTQSRKAVIDSLLEDHKRVQKIFKQFRGLDAQSDPQACQELAQLACAELKVHAQLEEEVFYPAVRQQLPDESLVDEATVEHASAKDLIGQLESMRPGDARYPATFKVLSEYVEHHIKEEEKSMFPKLTRSEMDWQQLSTQMEQRREELMQELMPEGAGKSMRDSERGSSQGRSAHAMR